MQMKSPTPSFQSVESAPTETNWPFKTGVGNLKTLKDQKQSKNHSWVPVSAQLDTGPNKVSKSSPRGEGLLFRSQQSGKGRGLLAHDRDRGQGDEPKAKAPTPDATGSLEEEGPPRHH